MDVSVGSQDSKRELPEESLTSVLQGLGLMEQSVIAMSAYKGVKMLQIYVAGKWQEKSAVRQVQRALKDAGFAITYDWTRQEDSWDKIKGTELQEHFLKQCAMDDLFGVMNADAVVVVLVNEDKYLSDSPNRYAEIGIAIGARIPVFILGESRCDFIFSRLPYVRKFETIEEVIRALYPTRTERPTRRSH